MQRPPLLSHQAQHILLRSSRLQHSLLRLLLNDEEQPSRRKLSDCRVLAAATQKAGSGRRLINLKRGTLAEERPDLVKQWVDEANNDTTPDTVGAGSDYRATWQCGCSCKHCSAPHPSWQATIPSRRAGTNCPYCSGNRVCVCQSIAALYPDLAKELDPGSIPGLDPYSVSPGSKIAASWVCTMHGSWVTQVGLRVRGTGCPSCARSAKRGPQPGRGLLRDECPDIHAQLHPTLNGDLKELDGMTCGSRAKLWWLCKEDKNRPQGCQHEHAWRTTVLHRCHKRRPSGCPFCTGRRVCQCNSISKLKPQLVPFWDYSRNSTINPDNLGPGSNLKIRAPKKEVIFVSNRPCYFDAGLTYSLPGDTFGFDRAFILGQE